MKKRYPAALFLLLITAAAVFHTALLSAYARWFTIDDATPGADAILILSGEPRTRIPKALELYRNGYAPVLIITRSARLTGFRPELFRDEHHLTRQALEAEKTAFALLPTSGRGCSSTFDEAYDAARYAADHNWSRIILVTDSYHTRRARYAFRKIFEQENVTVVIQTAAAPNAIYDHSNWWRTERGLSNYLLESIKFPVYLFMNRNSESLQPSP